MVQAKVVMRMVTDVKVAEDAGQAKEGNQRVRALNLLNCGQTLLALYAVPMNTKKRGCPAMTNTFRKGRPPVGDRCAA